VRFWCDDDDGELRSGTTPVAGLEMHERLCLDRVKAGDRAWSQMLTSRATYRAISSSSDTAVFGNCSPMSHPASAGCFPISQLRREAVSHRDSDSVFDTAR
jgi:hypothetical protein